MNRHANCVPSETGCLRCERTSEKNNAQPHALVLGALDSDADATLLSALETSRIEFLRRGPVVIVPNASPRFQSLCSTLEKSLTLVTQAQIKGAIASSTETLEEILGAMLFAEPLPTLFERVEFEWVREALSESCLFSLFQPIVDAYTGAVFAYEALIRARHPVTNEVIGAGPLIHACEQLDLHHQFDQFARQTAIRNAAALAMPDARFFINFLPNTIYNPEICLRRTMATAEEYGIPMHRLVFEVVESEQIPDMQRLKKILDYYRERGVGTAVDDLGAGFSTLEYLNALRPDFAKIDRDIVVEAEHDREFRDKLDSVVALAKRLHITVIAEGIETPGQMRVCVEAGVDLLQGYLFARPANPPHSVLETHFQTTTLMQKAA